jgi:hypothetical protein
MLLDLKQRLDERRRFATIATGSSMPDMQRRIYPSVATGNSLLTFGPIFPGTTHPDRMGPRATMWIWKSVPLA